MAFDPLKLEIVPKGLNLLPPGDQVAEGDCLQLDGFWPGSMGKLQQARGWVVKNVASGGGAINSLAEGDATLFFSEGSNLYKGSENGATVGTVDTGYDGYPLGMCPYQHIMWVMNRAKARRIGTGPNAGFPVSNWGDAAAAPAQPSGVMASGGGLADGQHVYYVSFMDQYGFETNPSPALNLFAPSGWFTDGTVALTNGSTSVTLTPSLSGGWGPEITGSQFLVPSQYPTITPLDPAPYTITFVTSTTATLSASWAGLTGSYSYELYQTPNSGKATVVRPNATGGLAGTVTGWNIYHLSPSLNAPYQVNLNGPLPYSTGALDPNQTAYNTYVDYGDAAHSQDDNTLLAADLVMEANHDPPPACSVMASVPYNGRLVVANSAAFPNRIWYTNPLEPNYFPGSGNPQAGNWVDVGSDSSDGILNLSVRSGMLVVYRQRSIWRVVGDLGDLSSTIAPLIPNMGIAGPRCVVGTSNGDLAIVRQGQNLGIYRVTDWEQRIGAKVEPILNGLGSEFYSTISQSAVATCALGYQLGRLWFSYPDGSNSTPNRTLICDIEQDTFSFSVSGRWFSRVGGFGAFLHGGLFFLGGAGGGSVFSLDDGTTGENGNHTPLAYRSPYLDCGHPDRQKTFGDLVISHNTGGATLGVWVKLDKDSDAFELTTISSNFSGADGVPSVVRQVIPLVYPVGHPTPGKPIEGFNISIGIVGNGPLAWPGAFIDGPILLHYYLKPRGVTQWDSGPTDHGMTGAKQVDAVEVDMDGGDMTLFIQSDIPGSGVMVERTPGGTGVLVANSGAGRQVRRYILTTPVAGRLLRYQLFVNGASGGATTLIYRVRVRALPLGVYVDGSMSDTWYTEPRAAIEDRAA